MIKVNINVALDDESERAAKYGASKLAEELGHAVSIEEALQYTIDIQLNQWEDLIKADKAVEHKEIIDKLASVDEAKVDQVKAILGLE